MGSAKYVWHRILSHAVAEKEDHVLSALLVLEREVERSLHVALSFLPPFVRLCNKQFSVEQCIQH